MMTIKQTYQKNRTKQKIIMYNHSSR